MTESVNRAAYSSNLSAAGDLSANGTVVTSDPKNIQELTNFVQITLQQMQDKFQSMSDQIINRIDEMGNRIDELERNIAELINQSGGDEPHHAR